MDIDWSEAPEGFDFHFRGKGKQDPGKFYKASEDRFVSEPGSYILYADMGELVDLFHVSTRPEVVVWNGEGLPPVGTACEYRVNSGPWYSCAIGYLFSDEGGEYAILKCPHLNYEQIAKIGSDLGSVSFRPIRTPEQIAAEEREMAIQAMCEHGVDAGDDTIYCTARSLYDAGYRKFEIVEGE